MSDEQTAEKTQPLGQLDCGARVKLHDLTTALDLDWWLRPRRGADPHYLAIDTQTQSMAPVENGKLEGA